MRGAPRSGTRINGLAITTVLTLDVRRGIYLFVPVMGAALLLAIAVHLVRLDSDT